MTDQEYPTAGKGGLLSRRAFLDLAAASAVGLTILPRRVLGGKGYVPPSDVVSVGVIGTGGQGLHNIRELFKLPDVRVTAVCDVNAESDYSKFYYKGTAGRLPALELIRKHNEESPGSASARGCGEYVDFRKMLEAEKALDAVLIATPDHNHAIASLAAIAAGKHVFCEKPLAHSIYETRRVTEAARKAGVATQMGNHGHSGEGIRLTVEWLRAGAIGPIREIHAWTSGGRGVPVERVGRPQDSPPVPSGFDWNRWLGPVAFRPYHPEYAPYNWRGWWAFGNGSLADMGCHNIDPAVWALELEHPETVEAHCVLPNEETTPLGSIVFYTFPRRGERPPVKLTWYDGGLLPARPEELEPGRNMGDNGILFVGDKGKILCGGWGGSPRLIPESRMKDYARPDKMLARVEGHHRDWINACKGGKPASSNFDYSGPLTELVLAGTVAMRVDKKLLWDGPNMKALNAPEADAYIRPAYHNGWTL